MNQRSLNFNWNSYYNHKLIEMLYLVEVEVEVEDRHAIEEEATNHGINNTTNKVIKVLPCAHCDVQGDSLLVSQPET